MCVYWCQGCVKCRNKKEGWVEGQTAPVCHTSHTPSSVSQWCVWVCSFTLCCHHAGNDYSQQAALCTPAGCCCCCSCGRSSLQLCFRALLAEKIPRDAALKKLPGNPFSAECIDTPGWKVFLVLALLLFWHCSTASQHLTFPAGLTHRADSRQVQITWHWGTEMRNSTFHVTHLVSYYCV